MNKLFKAIAYLLVCVFLFAAHYCLLNFFFFAGAGYNLILSVIILGAVFMRADTIYWLLIPLALLMESMSSMPFGFVSFSLLASSVAIYWLLNEIFTNRSLPIISLTTIAGVSVFRLSEDILTVLNWFLRDQTISINPGMIVGQLGIELIITVLFTAILYLVLSAAVRKIFPKKVLVFEDQGNIYGQKKFI